jgi:hypothetical protein
MHPVRAAARFTAIGTFCLLSGTAAAQDKWGSHLDFEAKPGTKRSLGEGDLFVPLWQDGRSLVFGNFRGRFDNDSGREGNLGVGVRRMYEGGWNLGGYGYFDRRKTENDNYFNQATFGAEALGRDWDLRANAYLPYGDRVKSGPTDTLASLSGTAVVVSSTDSEERALKGFDAEIGWRVPFFDVEAPRQLRVYAGGYRFKDDLAKVSGPRVRAEFAMTELSELWSGAQLMISAEAQDDDRRGSQGFVAVRVRIPLGGKAERSRLSWQERRMTAPVVRDVDIVAPVIAHPTIVETATETTGGQAFTVVSSALTAGNSLTAALTAAGPNSTVILSGTFSTTATATLQSGQTVMAGNVGVRTPSGRTAVLSSPATIAGTFSGMAVEAASNSTLSGLTIRNIGSAGTGTAGVRVNGVTGVTIANNVILASEMGNSSNGILLQGVNSVTIAGNDISAVVRNTGIATAINVFSAGSTATIANNTLSASGSPTINRFLGLAAGATINTAASTGNVAVSGVCLHLGATGFASFTNGTTCP